MTLALHALSVTDDAEYDRLMDEMDGIWVSMTADERSLASLELARTRTTRGG